MTFLAFGRVSDPLAYMGLYETLNFVFVDELSVDYSPTDGYAVAVYTKSEYGGGYIGMCIYGELK